MSEVFSYRHGTISDAPRIRTLWKGSNVVRSGEDAVRARLEQYPSAVIASANSQRTHAKGLDVVGFAYTVQLAPEVLELENIFIHEQYRNRNLGSTLLKLIEEQAANESYRVIMAFNSDLYESRENPKKPATGFYDKNNYSLVSDTGSTRVFIKSIS